MTRTGQKCVCQELFHETKVIFQHDFNNSFKYKIVVGINSAFEILQLQLNFVNVNYLSDRNAFLNFDQKETSHIFLNSKLKQFGEILIR